VGYSKLYRNFSVGSKIPAKVISVRLSLSFQGRQRQDKIQFSYKKNPGMNHGRTWLIARAGRRFARSKLFFNYGQSCNFECLK
jgi:hypothetical protein